jgi:hypothetical protein
MLKTQLTLKLNNSHDASRLWESIPARCREQAIEYYARPIGRAARAEINTGAMQEDSDEHDIES